MWVLVFPFYVARGHTEYKVNGKSQSTHPLLSLLIIHLLWGVCVCTGVYPGCREITQQLCGNWESCSASIYLLV